MLLKALRRRWVLALSLGLASAVLVGIIAWNVVPSAKYTAQSTLLVNQHTPIVIFEGKQKEPDFKVFQRTQIAWLTGDEVIRAALRDPKVAQLPTVREHADVDQTEWLKDQVKVLFTPDSEVLQVSISGDRPSDLEVLVNSVVDAYITHVVERDRRARLDRLEKLRKLWETEQSELKTKRNTLKQLSESAGASDRDTLAFMHQTLIDNLNQARIRRAQYMEEIRRLNLSLKVVDLMRNDPSHSDQSNSAQPETMEEVSATVVQHEIDHDPNVVRLREEEAKLSARLNRMRATMRRGHDDPAALKVVNDRSSIRHQLDDYIRTLRPQIEDRLAKQGTPTTGPVNTSTGLGLAQARAQLKILEQYKAETDKEIKDLQEQATKHNSNILDVSQEQEEILLASETARKVGTEIQTIEVELQAPERVQVISRADTPRKKDEMKRLRVIGMAVGGAFVFALFGVGFWEFRARRISSVDEVINNLGMTIVGSLPAFPDRPRRKLGGGPSAKSIEERWQKLLVESVDAMRTMLLHASRVESLRVVMVTSAGQGEGKTSLAGHLATSLARAGRNTLLVDCDVRRPTIHRIFDEQMDPGLCELLRGEIAPAEAIRQGPTPDLSIVTAGRHDEVAQQILGQDRVREIFEEWKQQFEFIIIDTPPILPVADSLFLSQHVDGVLFAILRGVSRVPHVQAAYDRIARLGVRMLGAVINGAESDAYQYSSHYYIDTPESE
jgi:capsular exopolysaccharide synthesis family protein